MEAMNLYKVVDNRDRIKRYLTKVFNEASEPSVVQVMVMQRRKDAGNADMKHSERVIKTYFINSVDHMEHVFDEVGELCDYFRARAYININPKSIKRCKWRLCKDLIDELEVDNARNIQGIVDGAVAKVGGNGKQTTWVVDLDDTSYYNEVKKQIESIYNATQNVNGDKESLFVMEYNTVNGMHLIIKPFDISKFTPKDGCYEIKKNVPTLLYANVLVNATNGNC